MRRLLRANPEIYPEGVGPAFRAFVVYLRHLMVAPATSSLEVAAAAAPSPATSGNADTGPHIYYSISYYDSYCYETGCVAG